MIKKILIGVDDSEAAENATRYGFDIAASLNAQVGLVHITEPVAVSQTNTGAGEILGTSIQGIDPLGMDVIDAQTQIAESILQKAADKYAGKLPVIQFNQYGSTGETIISCAAEFKADIIVLGTHSRSGFDRLLSGDIAEYVVRHSTIPVLVVPGKE